jgi:hypothetical protein
MKKRIQTKYWAVKEWQWRVDNWDYTISLDENFNKMIKDIPRLDEFYGLCSYCEKYKENWCPCLCCPRREWRLKAIRHENAQAEAEAVLEYIKENG